ncbi:MAG: hypothetical protein H6Q66_1923 [Firmicutes bacterium]|nr:hypothetical protein [Bacillota bacterium]
MMLLEGFEGYVTLGDIISSRKWRIIPKSKGVYSIISPEGFIPKYTATGSGGYYKGTNPNVAVPTLLDKWVDTANILYIGKAGASDQKTTLNDRIKAYMLFGSGKNRPHSGGRYIWQLSNVLKLSIAWKICDDGEEPIILERQLLNQFIAEYGKLPFANLV